MKQIDYLVIGHMAKDVANRGFVLGGTTLFAAVTATRLERKPAVVTSCEPGIDLQRVLSATPVCFAPSSTSTVFENIYHDGEREQHIRGKATDLRADHVPPIWRNSRLVHLAPIAQELTPDIIDVFAGSFIGLTPQGWLRGWDSTGKVFYKPWAEAPHVLAKVNAVVFSEEDIDYREDVVNYFATLAPVAVVTLGERGAKVHWGKTWQYVPAFPARKVDSTGAGDVFASAFFHRLEKTSDPVGSAIFASCTASFAVEAKGIAGIPTPDMVEKRLKGAWWPESSP